MKVKLPDIELPLTLPVWLGAPMPKVTSPSAETVPTIRLLTLPIEDGGSAPMVQITSGVASMPVEAPPV